MVSTGCQYDYPKRTAIVIALLSITCILCRAKLSPFFDKSTAGNCSSVNRISRIVVPCDVHERRVANRAFVRYFGASKSGDGRRTCVASHNQPLNLVDIDNNGILEKHDFECMALKMTLIEGKGEFNYNRYQENLHVMLSLWEEIAELADFNKDGIVTIEEFKEAVQNCCVGRSYRDFPQAMKMFIDSHFKIVDLNDDGVIAADEYRYNCVTRIPVDNVDILDEAYQNLLNDDDRRRGGLTLSRYQELYAQFLGNPDENCPAVHLFGPLHELC